MHAAEPLTASLPALWDSARSWLFEAALPLWHARGIDRARGGFVDLLDAEARPLPGRKRVFVQGRQAYSFAVAGRLGWSGPWREAVASGIALVRGPARHPEGGVVHRLLPDHTPDTLRRDLYDQAFTAFALAEVAGLFPEDELLAESRGIFTWLERDWARPPAGFWEGELPPQPPRRQNPYMHLLEAAIALARASGLAEDLARANRYAAFFRTRLFDEARGVLPEFFATDWSPAPGEEGRLVEPGHHFEWAWLLCGLRDLGGDDHTDAARRLWSFARRHGLCPERGVAVDSVLDDGAPHSARARLWPQTERLKAALAMRRLGEPEAAAEAVAAFAGLRSYFWDAPAGLFHDRSLPGGDFVAEPVRASSLYHIICAFAELHDAVVQEGAGAAARPSPCA